ncbi:MAG TPA: radical SAM protein [Anaerovoracaceae bacterium]|nr:radical SAM protein [Anaerovoracaceae bacterium]
MNFNLVLMITEKCNIQCKHCLFGEQEFMNNSRDMSVESMKSYIDQMADISAQEKGVFTVSFSGGEPILRLPQLLEICKYARARGAQKISSMTNGFWGANEAKAKQTVLALKDAGLDSICVSMDDFHQEYVPFSSVQTVLKLLNEHHIAFDIKCVVTKKTRRLAHVVGDLGDLLLNRTVVVQEIPCYPEGRAAAVIPPEDIIYSEGLPLEPCAAGFMLTILPDGTVYPCCGAGWSSALSLGNANGESIEKLFYKMKRNPILSILREKGPACLAGDLEKAGFVLEKEKFVGTCDLCLAVFTHPAFKEIAPGAAENWKQDRVEKIMSGLL